MTQHMGVIGPKNLFQILLAAANYSDSPDPPAQINEYIIANNLWTANVRSDSGQPDAWRDYQQVLSELALIFSTRVLKRITLTPLGLAYLDCAVDFTELMALQALRYQYPNGHKLQISPSLYPKVGDTWFNEAGSLAELQRANGVLVRPAVLTWRVLRALGKRGEEHRLTVDELVDYVMRCSTHRDTEMCVEAVIDARRKLTFRSPTKGNARRNAQDWIKFLRHTPFFTCNVGKNAFVGISEYGLGHADAIDEMCSILEKPDSFWRPKELDRSDRLSWYAWFGTIDIGIPLASQLSEPADSNVEVALTVEEKLDQRREPYDPVRSLNLRNFEPSSFMSLHRQMGGGWGTTIEATYDAKLAQSAHRLHDQMVVIIGNICRSKNAIVEHDPASVDLLVKQSGLEFIVEVKSVTPRNLVSRLRYAIGQIYQYDYLRSHESSVPRRKVIGVAAHVPQDAWCVPFLNDYLDFDLISLEGNTLRVHSASLATHDLFAPV